MTTPFPFVTVSGRPYERGREYGTVAAARIHASATLYAGQLDQFRFSENERKRLIGACIAEIEAFEPTYLQEMQGIADGAAAALEDIVMINARTEVIAKARMLSAAAGGDEDDDPDGCTGIVVLPERSRDGVLIQAQNWDWRPECVETAIVLRIRREEGPDILTFVEAGGLARHGLNSAGIGVTGNYLRCDRDYRTSGVPLALIRRKALDQEHVALAMGTIATTPKACATNMIVSHAAGWAIDFECAPDESFPLYPEDGLIVHANHWVNPVALGKLRDTGLAGSADTLYRDWRARRLLQGAGRPLGIEDVKAALFDDFLAPYSICRPVRPAHLGGDTASVAMLVMEPGAGVMEVVPMPSVNRVFTKYSLHGDPVMLEVAA